MPIESPGGVPAGTIRDLGLPGRAVTALLRAGVSTTEDLALLTRRELAAIDGLGAGMVAAIRNVVPEPVTRVPRATPSEAEVHTEAVAAGIEPADDEAPAPPPIPSFESLRAPRRRTTVDLIIPATPPPAEPAPAADPRPAAASGPRPAEYADLLRLCARGVRAAAGVPVRLAWWSLRAPVKGLRRLLGD
jgi:Bacterial RNA polymerase, alpha chain C terminal domain